MNQYEINTKRKGFKTYGRKDGQSNGSPFGRGIKVICIQCGRTLSRYDNTHRYAFCFCCRKALFPETIGPFKPDRNKPRRLYPNGQSL